MRALACVLIEAMLLLAVACGVNVGGHAITGSGHAVTRTYDLAGFRSVDVSSAFQLDVSRGDTFAVSVTADDNVFDDILVERDGATLRIGMRNGTTLIGTTTLGAKVTMPELDALTASGASRATMSGFTSIGTVDLTASGASTVSGDVAGAKLSVDVSGASRVDLSGHADAASLKGSGASRITLGDCTLQHATVELSGATSADVTVSGAIDRVDLSGASRLLYGGGASLGSVSTTGASTISQR